MNGMKRVFLADAYPDERSALRLLLMHLNLQIVGEAIDWPSTLALAPPTNPDLVVVDWGLVCSESGEALMELRMACPATIAIVLISHLDAREQAAISAGADAFISKGETSERSVERLRVAVGRA
jgi:DNA-binding NarL/FixJ family response regulator